MTQPEAMPTEPDHSPGAASALPDITCDVNGHCYAPVIAPQLHAGSEPVERTLKITPEGYAQAVNAAYLDGAREALRKVHAAGPRGGTHADAARLVAHELGVDL